jgi:hypothetical protein
MSPKSFVTYVPRLYPGVHVVPDANANAVALVYDLVNVDVTVDPGRYFSSDGGGPTPGWVSLPA